MGDPRSWANDPVARSYFDELEIRLKKDELAELLLESTRLTRSIDKQRGSGEGITPSRVSWCCYVASDLLLDNLGLPTAGPIEERRKVTPRQIVAMDVAIKAIEEAIQIDKAEFQMGDPQRLRGHEQTYDRKMQQRFGMAKTLRRLYEHAWKYLSEGSLDEAHEVGSAFFSFLLEHGEADEDLVEYGQDLVEVRE